MRIGLYGLPCAGKTYIMDKIDFMKTIHGSSTMKQRYPEFDNSTEDEKNKIRMDFAENLLQESEFIMDGHYCFGDNIAFTKADGKLYDVFLYLYVEPEIIRNRMKVSSKNRKYCGMDLEKWQIFEMERLREYCHEQDKDFYILDHPTKGDFENCDEILSFIRAVRNGLSCVAFARKCVNDILQQEKDTETVILSDGDKTVTVEDTSRQKYGYKTEIFDGNFYSGYQFWRHNRTYQSFINTRKESEKEAFEINDSIVRKLNTHSYIVTSGDGTIWEEIAKRLQLRCFYGSEMSADTKFFITKFLKQMGKKVIAYGDSKNDYYMLQKADEGFLVAKSDGTISRSLKNMDLGGINIVRIRENERSKGIN